MALIYLEYLASNEGVLGGFKSVGNGGQGVGAAKKRERGGFWMVVLSS